MTSTKLMQYVTSFSLVSKFTRNINHRYFIFLFELPNRMPITGSYLLPSFSLVTLEKIQLKIFLRSDLARARKSCPDHAAAPIKLHILTLT